MPAGRAATSPGASQPTLKLNPSTSTHSNGVEMQKYVQEVCARVAALQAQGDVSTARQLLRALLVVLRAQPTQQVFGSSQEGVLCRQLLGEAVVLLAITLLQEGQVAAADGLLSLLDFKHRLAAAAFLPAGQQPAALPAPAQQPQLPSSHAPLLGGHSGAESLEKAASGPAGYEFVLEGGLACAAVAQQPSGEPQQERQQQGQQGQQGQPQAIATTGVSRPSARPPAPPPLVIDSALPPAVLASLQQGFRPSAAFWQNHGYWEEAGSGFFSYVFPLAEPAQHPVEEAIAHLRQQLLSLAACDNSSMCHGPGENGHLRQDSCSAAAISDTPVSMLGREGRLGGSASPPRPPHGSCSRSSSDSVEPDGGDATKGASSDSMTRSGWERELAGRVGRASHAEWWVHCRDPADPHQLHFDVDETCLRRGRPHYSLRHPLLGSLLFLEGSPTHHGSTLILDQIPQDEGLAGHGWLVRPATGQYAAFRGDLLHGVMPGVRDACSQPRTTLMVAWWEFDAAQQEHLTQQAAQQAQRASQPEQPDAVAGGGPMQLPPWRLAACGAEGTVGSAAGCSWPEEFTAVSSKASHAEQGQQRQQQQQQQQQQPRAEQYQQAVHEGQSLAAPSTLCGGVGTPQLAAQALKSAAAVLHIEPVWEAVGGTCGSPSVDAQADAGQGEEQNVAAVRMPSRAVHPSSGDGARDTAQPSRTGEAGESHAPKRAHHGGKEKTSDDDDAARLPLLYPPLRFFLLEPGDIRGAYIPSGGAGGPQTGDML